MLIRKTQVHFDNGTVLKCKRILFRTDEYVVILTNNKLYELYSNMGENLTPKNSTYIAKGIRNQLIIAFDEIYEVCSLQNGILYPITFTLASSPEERLVCYDIHVVGGFNQKVPFFHYIITVSNGKKYLKGIGTHNGGDLWLEPLYTNIQVTEAGYVIEKEEDNNKLCGLINFDKKVILPIEYTKIICQNGMILAYKSSDEIKHKKCKVAAFNMDGEMILPIQFNHITVTDNVIVADDLNEKTKERFFYLYMLDGTPLYVNNCILYFFVEGTPYIIVRTKNTDNQEMVGVIDTITRTEFIQVQKQEITTHNDCFVVHKDFNGESKITQIVKFDKTTIVSYEKGFDEVIFLEKYLLCVSAKKLIVLDYDGKILAQ